MREQEEQCKQLNYELEQLRARPVTQSSSSAKKVTTERSESVIIFDASKIPVELTSSINDLNDVFSALQETPYGREAIQSLYHSAEEPIETSSDQEKGEPLRSLVRLALRSPKK